MSNGLTRAMILAGLCVLLGPARVMLAPIENRNILKTYFETGDTPTEGQFGNLIDSMLAGIDNSSLIGVWTDASGRAAMLRPGVTIGPGHAYSPAAGLSDQWLAGSGFLAMSFLKNNQTHYGYLQIEAGTDPTSPYPMLVEHLVYESQPDFSIETVEIPEPTTMILLAGACPFLLKLRRRRS